MVMKRSINNRSTNNRKGLGLIWCMMVLLVLCGLTSLAIDMGRVALVKTQLRAAADAAALAAGNYVGDRATARSIAAATAKLNKADGAAVVIDPNVDVEFVNWNESSRTYTVSGASDVANAVKVTARRIAARGNAVDLPFAKMLGANTCDVSAETIVMAKGGNFSLVGLDYVKMTGNANVTSVATNGYISMTGSAHVNGDVATGSGGVKGGRVNGQSSRLFAPLVYPSASLANVQSTYPALDGTSIKLSGSQTKTLDGSVYIFKDITLTGSSKIIFTSKCTVYVTGSIVMTGTTVAKDNDPANLKFIVIGTGKVSLTGTSQLYANIYAPNSPITITGTGDIYGPLVGKTISLTGNAQIQSGPSGKSTIQIVK
jgi:uncharacterized protein YdeI (BOF family)